MGETAGFASVITAVWKGEGFSPQPPPPSRKKGHYRASDDWQECGTGTWLAGTGPVPEQDHIRKATSPAGLPQAALRASQELPAVIFLLQPVVNPLVVG